MSRCRKFCATKVCMFFRTWINKIIKNLKESKWHIGTNTRFLVLSSPWQQMGLASIKKVKMRGKSVAEVSAMSWLDLKMIVALPP